MFNSSNTNNQSTLTPFEPYDIASKDSEGTLAKIALKFRLLMRSNRRKPPLDHRHHTSVARKASKSSPGTGTSIPRSSKTLVEASSHYNSYETLWPSGTTMIADFEDEEASRLESVDSDSKSEADGYRPLNNFMAQLQGTDREGYCAAGYESATCANHDIICCIECERTFCPECVLETALADHVQQLTQAQTCDSCYFGHRKQNRVEQTAAFSRQLDEAPRYISINSISGYVSPLYSPKIRISSRIIRTTEEELEDEAIFPLDMQDENKMDNQAGRSGLLQRKHFDSTEIASSSTIEEARVTDHPLFYAESGESAANGKSSSRRNRHRFSLPHPINESSTRPSTEKPKEYHLMQAWRNIADLVQPGSTNTAQDAVPSPPRARTPCQQREPRFIHSLAAPAPVTEDYPLLSGQVQEKLRSLLQDNGDVIGQANVQIWENVLMNLLSKVMDSRDLSVPGAEKIDIHQYLKIKKLPVGSPDDSYCMNGVMCSKNVARKRMAEKILNPRILILCFSLECSNYLAEDPCLRSDYSLQRQESKLLQRIIELQPSILLVELDCIVPYTLLDSLSHANIAVVCHMKRATLDKVSRCTGAEMVTSMSQLMMSDEITLGHCGIFRVDRFRDPRIPSPHKAFAVFDQCPVNLGVTVILQGGTMESLNVIKQIMKFMVVWRHNSPLETALLEGLSKMRSNRHQKRIAAGSQYSSLPQTTTSTEDEYHVEAIRLAMSPFRNADLSVSPMVGIREPHIFAKLQNAHDEIISFLKLTVPSEFKCRENQMPDHLDEMPEFFNMFNRSLLGNQEYYWLREKYDHCFRTLKDYPGVTELTPSHLMAYQRLGILECQTCLVTTTPRHNPDLYSFKYYHYDNDLTLGQYVEHVAAGADKPCPSDQCDRKMFDHSWCYVHGAGKVSVELKFSQVHAGDTETEGILRWSHCKHCQQDSPTLTMTESNWKYSFGKFLELLFYQTEDMTARDKETCWCPHSLLRDHEQYFSIKGTQICFRYEPIQLYEVRVPSMQLRTEQDICVRLKDSIRNDIASEIWTFYHTIEERHDSYQLDTVHPDDLKSCKERLHRMERDAKSEKKEILEYLDNIYRRTSPADPKFLNIIRFSLQNKAERWKITHKKFVQTFLYSDGKLSREPIPMLKHHPSMMTLEESLDQRTQEMMDTPDLPLFDGLDDDVSDLNIDTTINCRPELGDSPTGSRQQSLCLGDDTMAILQQGSGGQNSAGGLLNTRSKNATGFDEFVALLPSLPSIAYDWLADAAKSISATFNAAANTVNDDVDQSDRSESLHDEPATGFDCETFPVLYTDDLDVLHGHEETPIIDENIVGETSTWTPPRLSLGEDNGPVNDRLSILASFPDTHAFSTSRVNTDRSKTEQPVLENWLQALSRWTGKVDKSELLPLACPFSSTEHCFPDSLIIVDEDEPSTIAAYALDSREYHARVNAILNEYQSQNDEQDAHLSNEEKTSTYIENMLRDTTNETFRKEFEDNRSKFVCEAPFMKQFDALRRKCRCESSFTHSLASSSKSFSLTGKPEAEYHKTKDDRLVIKVISSGEMDEFLKLAPKHFQYLADAFANNRRTIFMKILGVYRIKHTYLATEKQKNDIDILIMENPFNGYTIDRIFNLKGSSRNRYLEATGLKDEVLLDGNLKEFIAQSSPLYLYPDSKQLLTRLIESDSRFLAKNNITNYSLLLGIDETNHELVVAITDFYRTFNFDRKLEHFAKETVSFFSSDGRDPTVRPPEPYRDRFRDEMDAFFLYVPDFWTKLDR